MSTEPGADTTLSDLLDLRVSAEAVAVAKIADSVSEALNRLQVPEEKRMEIDLAVQEALANAVVHGCNNDPSKEVRCRLLSDRDGRILIIVSDPGPGFDPGGVSNPKQEENLQADHGRGVYLIRQLMDKVQFAGRGNEIRMWKY